MSVTTLHPADLDPGSANWRARVDLAAAHRMAVMHDLHEGIFNHFTLAVPGTDDRYFQIPFGLHWSEVTASSILEVGYDGSLLKGEGEIERSAYCIHAPLHRDAPGAACVMHTHMPYASALTRLEDPSILPIGQTELGIMREVAYDTVYAGPAFECEEGERLVGVLGEKKIMLMANHGALTVGATVADAYDRLYYLERVAQVQLYAMWTGRPLKVLSEAVIAETYEGFEKAPKYGGKSSAEHHFEALKRMLDRQEPDYSD